MKDPENGQEAVRGQGGQLNIAQGVARVLPQRAKLQNFDIEKRLASCRGCFLCGKERR